MATGRWSGTGIPAVIVADSKCDWLGVSPAHARGSGAPPPLKGAAAIEPVCSSTATAGVGAAAVWVGCGFGVEEEESLRASIGFVRALQPVITRQPTRSEERTWERMAHGLEL